MKESNGLCKKTYAGIDYFRLIAAFMVIAIHVAPLSVWNEDIDYLFTYCLGRVAVPFFFMTTGYFVLAPYIESDGDFPPHKQKWRICRYFMKNTVLYVMASVMYLPLSVYSQNAPKTVTALLKQILFDGTFYHLWYFPAAMIGCILLIILCKCSVRAAIGFSLLAYVIGIFGDSYYGLIEGIPFFHSFYKGIFSISSYTRNGVFFAPAVILLGMLLALPEFHLRRELCRFGFVVSSLLMLLEGWMTYSFHLQRHNSMYLFLLPVLYFLFQLLLAVPGKAPDWIRHGSMLLYVMHPAVIVVLRGVAKAAKLTGILVDNTFIQYISVCIVSLAITCMVLAFPDKKGDDKNVSKRKGLDRA